MQPARQQRRDLQRVQQRDAELVGLHRLHRGLRQERPGVLAEPDTDPAPSDSDADALTHPNHTPGGCSAAAWVSNVAYVSGDVCPTAATSGPRTSGTTTRFPVGHQAPGTTTAPAETWRRATLCAPPGATPRSATALGEGIAASAGVAAALLAATPAVFESAPQVLRLPIELPEWSSTRQVVPRGNRRGPTRVVLSWREHSSSAGTCGLRRGESSQASGRTW